MKNLIVTTLALLLSLNIAFSQDDSTRLMKKVEYGLSIGHTFGNLIASDPDTPISIGTLDGIHTGILAKINFSDKVSLIPQGRIYFRDGVIESDSFFISEVKDLGHNEATIVIPIHIAYHPIGKKYGSPGLLIGPRYRYNISKDNESDGFNNHQLSVDLGLSIDLVFPNFTLRPMLSYSRGISNLLSPESTFEYGSKLKMHSYGITLQFFG